LLVDDEALVANMLRMGLERLGYQVTIRAGGPQGLAAFVEAPDSFDVVVSDQIMRGLTGVRLAREIHVLRPSVPVILVTGFRDAVEDDDRAGIAGVVEVLEKPLSHRDVAGAIERALSASARREREERA
jgi:DNA-binding NtrC family response regulator